MIIRSRAPVRVDFAGGWTDVALFTQEQPGFVVNAAMNTYFYVTAKKLKGKKTEGQSHDYRENKSVKVYSVDFDIYQEADEIKKLEYNGNIDLAKAAIKKSNIDFGVEIITRSNAPAGSGLGTSASMGVSLIGALSKLNGSPLLPHEIAEEASAIERYELNFLGGKQDQYTRAIGGFNFMEFRDEDVKVFPIPLNPHTLLELEKNLVICYTGKSRLSSNIHQKVVDAYREKNVETLEALRNLKHVVVDMKNALLKDDLRAFGELLSENWENQKKLHHSVTNPQIDDLFGLALKNGALGGKACGAGGGGCLIFYCESDKEHLLRRTLEETGVKIIDFNFDFTGLQTWLAS